MLSSYSNVSVILVSIEVTLLSWEEELTPIIDPSNLVIFWKIPVLGDADPCMEAVFFAVFANVETGVVVLLATARQSFFAGINSSLLLASDDLSIVSCVIVTVCPVIPFL